MDSQKLKKIKLPESPGVYLFKKGAKILYIGKATSLRDRVRSYFARDILETRGPVIAKMVQDATGLDYKVTDSVLEALVLEASLIRKFKPPSNSFGKDNKSYNYVVITKEDYPRVFTVRGRDLSTTWDADDIKYSFGPFPQGGQLKEAMRIIRKIFPFRGEKDPVRSDNKNKSYVSREIGLTPDFERVSWKEYAGTIRNLKLFFDGKKRQLIDNLKKEMKTAADEERFEAASEIKRQVFALTHIRDVSLVKEDLRSVEEDYRIEGFDVAHTSGTETVGVMVVVEGGYPNKSAYRKFKLRSLRGGDTAALKELLERRLNHDDWPLPKLIVVDGAKAQINVAENVLGDFGFEIPVVAVTKGVSHQPKRVVGQGDTVKKHERDILIANGEAHRYALSYHRQLLRKKRS